MSAIKNVRRRVARLSRPSPDGAPAATAGAGAVKRRAGIDAELLDERAARVPVDVQRLCLAARAVEREHELGSEALAERVSGDELLQLADDVRMPAEGEIGLYPALERGQAQLLKPRDRVLRERLVGEVGERWPAPERERLAQRLGRLGSIPGAERALAGLHELLERVQIELSRLDAEHVAASTRDQVGARRAAVLERSAQL